MCVCVCKGRGDVVTQKLVCRALPWWVDGWVSSFVGNLCDCVCHTIYEQNTYLCVQTFTYIAYVHVKSEYMMHGVCVYVCVRVRAGVYVHCERDTGQQERTLSRQTGHRRLWIRAKHSWHVYI